MLGFKLSPIPPHEKPVPEQETLLQQIDFYFEELKKIHLKVKLDQDAKEVGPYLRETTPKPRFSKPLFSKYLDLVNKLQLPSAYFTI